MTEQVKKMKAFILDRFYRQKRRDDRPDLVPLIIDRNRYDAFYQFLQGMLHFEEPVIYENDIFGFNRSFTGYGNRTLDGVCLHPFRPNNMTPNYSLLMDRGFDSVITEIESRLANSNGKQAQFYESTLDILRCGIEFSNRYRDAAKAQNNIKLYSALCNIPRNKPASFYEACVFQKLLIMLLRVSAHPHLTLGRFDQYMYPYFEADLQKGVSKEELFETLELYFLSFNIDSDTYDGVQQGDNGQSMVLGGFDAEGNNMFNELSKMCMEASLELGVIDPKINLRVGKNTPDELYELGTALTKKGLGFPQYCNDDVVVPGLTALGYAYEDALDYTVAACWEYIIPGKSLDIPNITTFNFPLIIRNAIYDNLNKSGSFDELLHYVEYGIQEEVDRLIAEFSTGASTQQASPLMSLMTEGCLENGLDISEGGTKYYCLGCHGAGISTAADSLAAVKKLVYDEGSCDKDTLLNALDQNFSGYTSLRNQLLACPKMGNDDDYVDSIAVVLLQAFSNAMAGKPTGFYNGFWRPGTGSAMEYIWSARNVPATPDGRYAAEPFGCSYSPSLHARVNGPLSVIRSFTKFDLSKVINGGPLTLEIHDNVFRNKEGEEKIAQLVKLFVLSGGHQLQLNAINRERLLDAQAHPEKYPNLVVRVWGWSGYFCELDLEFQNHIIQRTEFTV